MAIEDMGNGGSSTSWGVVIFFLILFFIFIGGGGNGWFGGRNCMNGPAETTALLQKGDANTASLENSIRNMQDIVTASVQNSTNQLAEQNRRQYDAQLGERMFDLKLKALSDQQSYEAKLAAKDATIERMTMMQQVSAQFGVLEKQIANISCQMLTKPQVTGIGAVCPNSGIINGLGIGTGLGNNCGCNGNNINVV